MDDTGFYVPERNTADYRMFIHWFNDSLKKEQPSMNGMNFKVPATLFSGGGGLVSTMNDYSRFACMLLNGGELEGVRILSQPTVEMIMSNQLPEGVNYENGGSYGLGGSVNPDKGHYGWSGAASLILLSIRKTI